ncbi:MAG TPA: protein kinase [Pyrinomonadaceae bacterium]|jgi:serine/threonine-protein kinase|nr:protein kinase [Pyrinomonadaceae bacterium]
MLHCPTCGRQYSTDFEICPEDQSPLQADATIMGAAPVDPLLGHTLDGKYRLEERLGVGGMGTVYRALHLLIDRPVAIKVLNRLFVEDEAARTRFRREARAAGRLQHPNAVTVTDFGESQDGYVYLVMELLEGRTLRDVLAKEAPLDVARSVALMVQISAAVAAAHEAGIIHRDLKPANIFIVQRPEVPAVVKVLDFGIAKLAAELLEEEEQEALALTQVGAMIGTPRYMSPEQCDGVDLTPAADVYSLGCILYEMITGTVPFSGSTPLAIAVKQTSEIPRSPREFVSSIPPALERVVLHTLEKRPENRPANAAAFREELMATAERLGLEHAAATSSPDLAALRSVGTESPSGRLIIDISRLRETRANNAEAELTAISPGLAGRNADGYGAATNAETVKPTFPRLSFSLNGSDSKKRLKLLAVVIVALLVIAGVFAIRSRNAAAPAPLVAATPTPTPEPSPTPSPSPSPSPKVVEKKPAVQPKKESKAKAFVNKVKRFLKKPF